MGCSKVDQLMSLRQSKQEKGNCQINFPSYASTSKKEVLINILAPEGFNFSPQPVDPAFDSCACFTGHLQDGDARIQSQNSFA